MSTISASTTSNTAFKVTSDTTGTLVLQTGAVPTTAISISASQVVSIGSIAVTGVTTFSAGSAAAPSITTTGDTNTGLFFPAADTIAFTEGGVESMRIDSSGNIGLGVTPSATWTSAAKVMQLGGFNSIFGYSSHVLRLANNAIFTASNETYGASSIGATYYQQYNGIHTWLNAPSGTAGNAISFTEAMRLDASGNLILNGTTQIAGSKLNVRGDGSYIGVGGSTVQLLIGDNGSTNGFLGTFTNHDLTIRTNNIERARILAGGNFCIGKTSASEAATTGSGFGFASPTSDPYFTIVNNTAAGVNGCMYLNRRNTQVSNILLYFMTNDGTTSAAVGSITHNGTATAYNTSSDYRLKTVLGAVANAGQRIDALQPVEYTWNANGERARGFLAHQFQEVYVSSVSGTKDAVDVEGNPVYQSMQASTSEVIADLVAELQSVRARLAALESK